VEHTESLNSRGAWGVRFVGGCFFNGAEYAGSDADQQASLTSGFHSFPGCWLGRQRSFASLSFLLHNILDPWRGIGECGVELFHQ
jgi:hypothetical protein